jgi:hypothetical protein
MDNDKAITSGDVAGGADSALDLSTEADRGLVRTALTRWPRQYDKVDAGFKRMLVTQLVKAAREVEQIGAVDKRVQARTSIAKTGAMMVGQNQADEHAAEKNKRLDEGLPTDNVVIRVPPPRTFKESQG